MPGVPGRYAVEHRPGVLAISRQDHGIEASLEVTVVPEADVELRVVRLWNRMSVARRLELTTCLEVVLSSRPTTGSASWRSGSRTWSRGPAGSC